MSSIAVRPELPFALGWAPGHGVSRESRKLADFAFDQRDRDAETVVLGWRELIRGEIQALMEECSVVGWNGYNADPIVEEVADAAQSFVQLLPDGILTPEIVPEPDGGLGLEWNDFDLGSLVVSFLDGRIFYSAVFGPSTRATGSEVYDDAMPKEISDLLARYFSNR